MEAAAAARLREVKVTSPCGGPWAPSVTTVQPWAEGQAGKSGPAEPCTQPCSRAARSPCRCQRTTRGCERPSPAICPEGESQQSRGRRADKQTRRMSRLAVLEPGGRHLVGRESPGPSGSRTQDVANSASEVRIPSWPTGPAGDELGRPQSLLPEMALAQCVCEQRAARMWP